MKEVIYTENAPKPLKGAPYSQGIKFGKLIFLSGQIPIDPKTNKIVSGGIEKQVEQVLNNIKALLEEANSDFDMVLKTTVFLEDMNDFAKMNEVYKRYFKKTPPARSCIEVKRLPMDVKVEIEVIAYTK